MSNQQTLDPDNSDVEEQTSSTSTPEPKHATKTAFQDISASLPFSNYWGESDLNKRSRGRVDVPRKFSSARNAKKLTTETSPSQSTVTEPETASESVYPHNKVIETTQGHILELDDTPGHERIRVFHKTGSQIEMRPDGSIRYRSMKNSYHLTAGNEETIIRGNCNIIIEASANLRVKGDMTMQVDGDYNLLVHGDMSHEVAGNLETRVHGDNSERTTGFKLLETRGNVEFRHLGDSFLEKTFGTHTSNVGGNISITTESDFELIGDGDLSAEFEGGFFQIKGTTSYFAADTGYFDTEIHTETGYATTWEGDLEGTATKAIYATTAGSAPTGVSNPTTPDPTTPESSPNSNLSAINITDSSDELIKDLDRSVVNGGYNKRRLNCYEVYRHARNTTLRRDQEWLQDQINTEAIAMSINTSSPPSASRSISSISSTTTGVRGVSHLSDGSSRTFTIPTNKKLKITEPNSAFQISGALSSSTRITPSFVLAQLLGSDSEASFLDSSELLVSQETAVTNLQLLAYNVLEPLLDKFGSNWTVSESLYVPLPNEKLDPSSINLPFAKGLGVGIQLPDLPQSAYFDYASWCLNNLIFDKLVLSYIDYDPNETNEPTLLITISKGNNSKSFSTEFNHQVVGSGLQDLSS